MKHLELARQHLVLCVMVFYMEVLGIRVSDIVLHQSDGSIVVAEDLCGSGLIEKP